MCVNIAYYILLAAPKLNYNSYMVLIIKEVFFLLLIAVE